LGGGVGPFRSDAGDLNPTAAFMQGKLKIEGDMSVAMALSQLF